MSSRWHAAAAAVVAVVVAVTTAGAASADNSNSNSNTNDVTQLGSPSAANETGGGGATEKTNWPPTDLSWPPSAISNGGVDSGGKKGGENESSSATPIVMPSGQTAPTPTAAPSTEATAQPIVAVNTP
jgi:hypothetical protein